MSATAQPVTFKAGLRTAWESVKEDARNVVKGTRQAWTATANATKAAIQSPVAKRTAQWGRDSFLPAAGRTLYATLATALSATGAALFLASGAVAAVGYGVSKAGPAKSDGFVSKLLKGLFITAPALLLMGGGALGMLGGGLATGIGAAKVKRAIWPGAVEETNAPGADSGAAASASDPPPDDPPASGGPDSRRPDGPTSPPPGGAENEGGAATGGGTDVVSAHAVRRGGLNASSVSSTRRHTRTVEEPARHETRRSRPRGPSVLPATSRPAKPQSPAKESPVTTPTPMAASTAPLSPKTEADTATAYWFAHAGEKKTPELHGAALAGKDLSSSPAGATFDRSVSAAEFQALLPKTPKS